MRTPKLALVIVMAAAAGLSCDDSKGGSADGGGRDGSSTGGTGGSVSTGGTGGTTATGGTTGGTTATGGTGTGGTTATGGTGGTTATGGTGGTATTGGTGGTAATGGTGGTSATGGTGGTPASCEIPCLTSLITDCQPMGTCMSQTVLALPPVINQCYTNGVKVSLSGTFAPGAAGNVVITYRKNGNVCYSIESPFDAAGNSTMFTVKNPAGTAVATGTYGMGGSMPMVTCTGGMTYNLSNPACVNVPRPSIPGQGGGDAGAGCPMGTCQ